MKEIVDSQTPVDELSPDPLDRGADLSADEQMFGEGEDDEDHDDSDTVEDIETSKHDPLPSDDFKIEYDEGLQSLVDGTRPFFYSDFCV